MHQHKNKVPEESSSKHYKYIFYFQPFYRSKRGNDVQRGEINPYNITHIKESKNLQKTFHYVTVEYHLTIHTVFCFVLIIIEN